MNQEFVYRCKKCRCLLFTEQDIQEHEPNANKVSFGYRRVGGGGECNSYFLKDRKEWMGSMDGNDDKLHCKCGADVGFYYWSGSQCSCGRWITPAIQINKSKVDKEKPFVVK